MASASDLIWDVYWEGPFPWAKRDKVSQDQYVLYAIYGTHRVYGPKSLLYIGRTARVGGNRLDEHDWWVQEESEPIKLYLASIGKFDSWSSWESRDAYTTADDKTVAAIEALLIYAHQPAYNSQDLQALSEFRPIRVFNSGRYATLLPEVSYRYYIDP